MANAELLGRIRQKRTRLDAFLAAELPRKRRLLNTTIIGGTLAAALTAGPAVGGASLTGSLTKAFGLSASAPSWRLLCAAASFCSIVATLATQLLRSNNSEEHVTRALGSRAKLEALELGLSLGQLDDSQAASEYLKCVEDTAFLREV
ncbi:MAG: hypothetical protein ABI442_16795 [Gemmatimonadaceae bacterium]